MEALEEFLRFWVAFSVVDEDSVGSVSVGDLKASEPPHSHALDSVGFWVSCAALSKRRRHAPSFKCPALQEIRLEGKGMHTAVG